MTLAPTSTSSLTLTPIPTLRPTLPLPPPPNQVSKTIKNFIYKINIGQRMFRSYRYKLHAQLSVLVLQFDKLVRAWILSPLLHHRPAHPSLPYHTIYMRTPLLQFNKLVRV